MMKRKGLNKFLSIILTLAICLSYCVMGTQAAEENVASIGSTFYNSVNAALAAAVSGDTVVIRKSTSLTENAEVKSGVKLVVPHKEDYTGYDLSSSSPTPDTSSSKSEVTETLYRALTIPSGVTLTVNGSVYVSAVIGVAVGGSFRQDVNGAYAQITLDGKMVVANGGKVVCDGYIKGSGEIEALSGSEIRDCFVLVHWRGGTHASIMRVQKIWPANEYDSHNIQVKITIRSGAKLTGTLTTYIDSSYQHSIIPIISSDESLLIINSGGYAVKTYEYRERIGTYAEVIQLYGGGALGNIELTLSVGVISDSVDSSSFVVSLDGDYEVHLYDGKYHTYTNSTAISMKFLPGSELTVHDGAMFCVERYKTVVRNRCSKISFYYTDLPESAYAESYRYPTGRPAAKLTIDDGGTLYYNGALGGNVYLSEKATVVRGEYAEESVETKESTEIKSTSTQTITTDLILHAPEGYHLTSWSSTTLDVADYDDYSKEKLSWEKHSNVLTSVESLPTCTSSGVNVYTCSVCGEVTRETVPATGHTPSSSVVTSPTCTKQGFTTNICSVCSQSYVDNYVDALGHTYSEKVTAPTCTEKGFTTYTCHCGDTFNSDFVSELGHSYGDWIEVTPAECEKDGTRYKLCGRCSDRVDGTISAFGHTYSAKVTAPTCTEKGFTTYTCHCGDTYNSDFVSELGHNEEIDEAIEPTCTEDGLTEGLHCSRCNKILIPQTTVSALGHTYSAKVTAPTCTENGFTTYTCHCGDTYDDNHVDMTGHKTGRIETIDATAVSDGLRTTYCDYCGEIISTEKIEKPQGKLALTIGSNGKTILTGTVSSDFSAILTVPHGCVINTGEITAAMTMTNVPSLGITDSKSFEKTVLTGVEKEVELDKYLPEFNSATVKGAIDGNEYSYLLSGSNTNESYSVEAHPEDEEAVRLAWQSLISHIATSEKADSDSFIEIPGTAYMQIGTEKISFEDKEDTLRLDNLVSGSGIKAKIRNSLKLEDADELKNAQIEIYLPVGTVIALGQSVATLKEHAKITVYGYEDSEDVNRILSRLRDAETNEEIIKTAVLFLCDAAAAIDGKTVTVNVDFSHTPADTWETEKAPTATDEGKAVKKCTMCGAVCDEKVIPKTGVTVLFNVTSYGTDLFGDTTIELYSEGSDTPTYTLTVSGNGKKECSLDGVEIGKYRAVVSKKAHATREYTLELTQSGTECEMKICLLGDVTADGKVSMSDLAKINSYLCSGTTLEEYEKKCADINGDSRVNLSDLARVNSYIQGISLLW